MNSFGPLTLDTVGTGRTFTGFGFDPTELEFTAGAKGGNSSLLNWCEGAVDSSGTQFANCFFADPSSRRSYNDRVIELWEHVSGVWTVVLQANFHSFTTDGFKINVTVANPNYQVFVRARNT